MSSANLIKKLIGLNIFQVSALLLYISVAHIKEYRVLRFNQHDPNAALDTTHNYRTVIGCLARLYCRYTIQAALN